MAPVQCPESGGGAEAAAATQVPRRRSHLPRRHLPSQQPLLVQPHALQRQLCASNSAAARMADTMNWLQHRQARRPAQQPRRRRSGTQLTLQKPPPLRLGVLGQYTLP